MAEEKAINLNGKQEKFAQEVVKNGGDKVAAYKASGWSWERFSANALSVESDKQFNHPKISLRIAQLQAQKDAIAKEEFGIDAKYVLQRLHDIDQLDILDIMSDDLSGFKKLSEWPKVWRISINALDIKRLAAGDTDIETVMEKVKWPDKTKNLEMIGKHININAFKEVVEHTGEVVMFNMDYGKKSVNAND
jgi:phage terminase small subunit